LLLYSFWYSYVTPHLRASSLLMGTSSADEWLITFTPTGRPCQEPAQQQQQQQSCFKKLCV
jgi:hypothetical protein